jgi:alanyl-tRNA synthetase
VSAPADRLPAYEREPTRTSLATAVVATGVEGGRPWAVLEDTILYPEGGGQPPDRGTLNGVAVLDVQKKDGAIRHTLATPVAMGPADLHLDWERRFDHMQQHTGQHLLSAVAQGRFGWETTAFHLGPEVSDVELAASPLSPADLARLEEAVAAEIRAARPVVPRRVSLAEFHALPVRTRGLPEGLTGDVRLVEIAGVDVNTCSGTHVANTAEIEVVSLLGSASLRGGTRVFFVAGGRARRRMARHEGRNAALRVALGAPDDGLLDAAKAKVEQLAEAQKALRRAEESLAEAAAEALLAADRRVAQAHFEGRDMAFVQSVARRFTERAGPRAALLTATKNGQHVFALGAGEGFGDAQALGREVAALLGGKGGGSGRVFQGKAESLGGVEEALTRLAGTGV